MRILSIACGVAVLITTLHLGHGLHHFFNVASQEGMHGAGAWAVMGGTVVVGVFSLIGGCLLLKGNR